MFKFLSSLQPLILAFCAVSACSVAPPGTDIHDPNEAHNRQIHAFNKSLSERFSSSDEPSEPRPPLIDPELTQPIANFADNTALPGMVLNGMLQADIGAAATNAVRFILNTTVGIGGLFDPAGTIGLVAEETDFGETLAVWGAPEGAYIELPFAGPTTERALAGWLVDAVIDPFDRVATQTQIDYALPAFVAERLIRRGQLSGAIDDLYSSTDSYEQQRLVYYQNRRFDLGLQADDVDPYDDPYGQ